MSKIHSLVKTILESTLDELNLNEYRTKGATGLKNMSPEELAAHDAARQAAYQAKLTGNAVGRPAKDRFNLDNIDTDTDATWEVDSLADSLHGHNKELETQLNGVLLGYKKLLDLQKELEGSVSANKIPDTSRFKSIIEDIKQRSNMILSYPKYQYAFVLEKLQAMVDNDIKNKYPRAEKYIQEELPKGNYLDTVKARIRELWEKFKNNELTYNDIKDVHEVEQWIDPESLEIDVK